MHEMVLYSIGGIVILGILAQWVAYALRVPSILLLLGAGFVVGPVLGLLNPDAIFGELLFPVVSLAVAMILFEGGLGLCLKDLKAVRRPVWHLITLGTMVTLLVGMLGAHYLLGLDFALSMLLAAILVVSGPTVVTPLLNFIQPEGRVRSILHWEGILIDPVGATLAMIVFTAIESSNFAELSVLYMAGGVTLALMVGSVVGALMAFALVVVFKRDLVPETLQAPLALVLATLAYMLANALVLESGLMAVTVMGVVLANQRKVDVQRIIDFEENIAVFLLSGLFIVLAARVNMADLLAVGPGGALFVLLLVLVARPLAVWVSTWRTGLEARERVFVAGMAPRGIVAVSVASLFALELTEAGYPGAEMLMPVTFIVVAGTVTIYSVGSGLLARWLGLVPQDARVVREQGALSQPATIVPSMATGDTLSASQPMGSD